MQRQTILLDGIEQCRGYWLERAAGLDRRWGKPSWREGQFCCWVMNSTNGEMGELSNWKVVN